MFRLHVESFLLVTYAVPVERVVRHLPSGLEPDTVTGADGAPRGLFSVTFFHTRDLHLSALPFPRFSYRQSTFRIYCHTPEGKEGVYFVGTYLEPPGYYLQRPLAQDARRARFRSEAAFMPRGEWSARIESRAGDEVLELDAAGTDQPPDDPEFAEWITQRLNGWLRLTTGGYAEQEVGHAVLPTRAGTLRHARIDHFTKLGLLTKAESQQPYTVHFTPGATFSGKRVHRARFRAG